MHTTIVVAAALGIAACGGESEEATITTTSSTVPETTTTAATTSTTSTTVRVTTTTAPAVEFRQPLTGEPADSESDLVDRPALAVKIDNHPLARPNHSGLAVADIVFEEKVEGELTRFAAVFQSQDADPIGPIRSGREQDVALLSSLNQPLFAWSGGNPGVTRLVRASDLTDLNWQQNPGSYYRGDGPGPHNLYSDTAQLYALTPEDQPGPPELQFSYRLDDVDFDGEPVDGVSFSIGSIEIEWAWNADTERFERSQEGEEHLDTTYGRIGAENVIVLGVDYRRSSIDANAPEAVTVGTGAVAVFSDGGFVTGLWERDTAEDTFTLTLDDGGQIELTPGQTWIELVEVESAGDPPELTVDS